MNDMEQLPPAPPRWTIRWDWLIKLAPVLVVVATGVFYLNGIAFRQGYLGHFHLVDSMFDDDVGSQVAFAVRGWQEILKQLLANLLPSVARLILALVIIAVIVRVLWAVERRGWALHRAMRSKGRKFNAALRRKAIVRRTRRDSPHPLRDTPVVRRLVLGTLSLLFAIIILFIVVDTFGALLGLCVWPFNIAGRSSAARDEAVGFAGAPSVTITKSDGQKTEFKVSTPP
jgi:hypothetical protein